MAVGTGGGQEGGNILAPKLYSSYTLLKRVDIYLLKNHKEYARFQRRPFWIENYCPKRKNPG